MSIGMCVSSPWNFIKHTVVVEGRPR